MKPRKRRDVEVALREQGCFVKSEDGIHTKRAHHLTRVVRDTVRRLPCLPKGWLQ